MISIACESPDEELDDSDSCHGGAGFDQLLDILGEPTVAAEPGKGALDDPAPGRQVEPLGIARAPDDLEAEPFLRGSAGGLVTLIAGVGVDQRQDQGNRRRTRRQTSARPSRS